MVEPFVQYKMSRQNELIVLILSALCLTISVLLLMENKAAFKPR